MNNENNKKLFLNTYPMPLSKNIVESLIYVCGRHPCIARPGAEWFNLHAGDAQTLMEVILPELNWEPYVTNVEINESKHRDYGIDPKRGRGRAKFVPYKAEEYVLNIGYRRPELVLAISPDNLCFIPPLNTKAKEANPDGAILVYTDYSSDEKLALAAFGYEIYTDGSSIVVGYKPQTIMVENPKVSSIKARKILGL